MLTSTARRSLKINSSQALLLLSLFAVCLLAWLALARMAAKMAAGMAGMGAGMADMAGMDMAGMLMDATAPAPWTATEFLLMFGMWAVMMVGMMLPSATPMILLYQAVARRRTSRKRLLLSVLLFALAYLSVWTVFSAAATILQWALQQLALLSPMLVSNSAWLGGGLLIAAGVYQWLPIKQACLARCRSPMSFILRNWRAGLSGAWRMGLSHGLYCLGCCGVLMLLLFVLGVMNLLWIAALSGFVLLEKLAPLGGWMGRLAGVGLMAWGLRLVAG